MKRMGTTTGLGLLCLLVCLGAWAQSPAEESPAGPQTSTAALNAGSFPRLVRFGGTLAERRGASPTAAAAAQVTFSIYEDQAGGAALWSEVQDVRVDAQGRYSVLLGAASSDGLPAELFSNAGALAGRAGRGSPGRIAHLVSRCSLRLESCRRGHAGREAGFGVRPVDAGENCASEHDSDCRDRDEYRLP